MQVKIVDENGDELPHDGEAFGELLIRGPWIAAEYYKDSRSSETFQDGWMRTGDVCKITPEGYIRITDRAKDVIKSGGEWISSLDLENTLMAHPAVAEATVVGLKHQKWQERPGCLRGSQARRHRHRGGASWPSWATRSPSGGSPTGWSSSTRFRRQEPGNSTRRSCAISTPTFSWPDRERWHTSTPGAIGLRRKSHLVPASDARYSVGASKGKRACSKSFSSLSTGRVIRPSRPVSVSQRTSKRRSTTARSAWQEFEVAGSGDAYAWWVVREPGAQLARWIADNHSHKEFAVDVRSGALVEIRSSGRLIGSSEILV